LNNLQEFDLITFSLQNVPHGNEELRRLQHHAAPSKLSLKTVKGQTKLYIYIYMHIL